MNNKLVSHYKLADYEYSYSLDSSRRFAPRPQPAAYCDSQPCSIRTGERRRNLGLKINCEKQVDWCPFCGHALIWKV